MIWQTDPYNLAHLAVKKERGPANSHRCVDCGEQAYDWTLKENPIGPVEASGSSRYSTKPEDYEPRCRRCHTLLDDNTGEARIKLAELRHDEAFRATHAEATRQGIANARQTDNRWGAGRR